MIQNCLNFIISMFSDAAAWLLSAEFISGVSVGALFLAAFMFNVIISALLLVVRS